MVGINPFVSSGGVILPFNVAMYAFSPNYQLQAILSDTPNVGKLNQMFLPRRGVVCMYYGCWVYLDAE